MLVISGKLNNLNDYITASNRNRFMGAKIKKEDTLLVATLARQQLMTPLEGSFCLKIRFYEPNMRRDPDNVAGWACKVILDGLQDAGVIRQDNWAHVKGISYEFHVDKINPRIEVSLHDVCTPAIL